MVEDDVARAQLGPAGPVQIARIWLEAVLRDRDLRQAWLVTHPQLRREFAKAWVGANANHVALAFRDRAELVENLRAIRPDDPLWSAFEQTTLEEFDEKWPHVDLDTWGWASAPRVVGPDRELVYLVDTDNPNLIDKGTHYVVRGDEGEEVPVPGQGLVLEHLKAGETEGVQVMADNLENLWRVVDFYSAEAAGAREEPGSAF